MAFFLTYLRGRDCYGNEQISRLDVNQPHTPCWCITMAAVEALAEIRQMDVDVDVVLFSIETYAKISVGIQLSSQMSREPKAGERPSYLLRWEHHICSIGRG